MSKYATTGTAPVLGTTGAVTKTHEGGDGFVREPKAELYITAVSSLMKQTFYESEEVREDRLANLSRRIGVEDPEWTIRFITWLRREANMRSVAVVVACNAVKGRLDTKLQGFNRQLISAAILRADEPAEVIAYWQARFGRNLPMPVKRGVADAARKVYSERSALRYDGGSGTMRLGDVIELVHPKPKGPAQSALFGYLLDRRHGVRETPEADLALLPMITARAELTALSTRERHEFARKVLALDPDAETKWNRALAGQWEWGKSWLGQDGEDKTFKRLSEADQWKLFIHNGMGYMALLRNLRNFDEAKLDGDVRKHVAAVLGSEDEVKRSRQFPFRFFSAFNATSGGTWAEPLSQGLSLSLDNVPSLAGRSLILVDMSGSMFGWSGRTETVTQAEQAALFGTALAIRAEAANLFQYGTGHAAVTVDKTKGILDNMAKFHSMGGTNTMQAVRDNFVAGKHDRVIIITDEQASYDGRGGLNDIVPESIPVYTWNVAGYRAAHVASGPNRHSFGGLTDQSWGTIPLIEAGATQDWPF
jgi:hypothetical protein